MQDYQKPRIQDAGQACAKISFLSLKITNKHVRLSGYATLVTSDFLLHNGLFGKGAAALNSIVSNSYYGRQRGQIHTNLLLEHPIIAI